MVAAFAALLGLVLVVGVLGVLTAFQGWNRRLELRREALEAHTQVAELEGAYVLEENALLTFVVPATGDYFVRVGPQSGAGAEPFAGPRRNKVIGPDVIRPTGTKTNTRVIV